MKLAAHQPYLFPYLAYWQLINYVDVFVIADKLQYMKQSYITRNDILLENRRYKFSLEVLGLHLGKSIDELGVGRNKHKLLRTISHGYRRAPYYQHIYPLIEDILLNNEKNLAKFIIYSIIKIAEYLEINTKLSYHPLDKTLEYQQRIIQISKDFNADQFINAINGQKLYAKDVFSSEGIKLNFLKMDEIKYKQFNDEFVPNLSIIDVMMFNSKAEVQKMLKEFTLI